MKTESGRKYLLIFCLTFFCLAAGIAMLNWWVDPLQFYRKAEYPAYLIKEKRFQYPSLARNYEYDSVVIGTSVSENFVPSLLQERLKWKTLNLSMPGASAREQYLMLQVALRTGRVKNVLWDLNLEYLGGSGDWVSDYDGAFPDYLYDENPWNDINNYLLNLDTAKGSLKVLLKRAGLPAYRERTVEELFSTVEGKHGREMVWAAWERRPGGRGTQQFEERVRGLTKENVVRNFDRYFVASAVQNPKTHFSIYLPPITPAYFSKIKSVSTEAFEALIALRERALEADRENKNISVYDFQTGNNVLISVDNYRDLVHFDRVVNEYIVAAVGNGYDRLQLPYLEYFKQFLSDDYLAEWLALDGAKKK